MAALPEDAFTAGELNSLQGCGRRQRLLHPLRDLEHPFERAGLVARIWPNPPERLDISMLAVLSSDGRAQLGGCSSAVALRSTCQPSVGAQLSRQYPLVAHDVSPSPLPRGHRDEER